VSKGNPTVESAREIILDPEIKMEITFALGLGISTNNQYEAYVLFKGLFLAKESNKKSLIVIGDSSVIIKSMVMESTP
jgi:ribonuclease HI